MRYLIYLFNETSRKKSNNHDAIKMQSLQEEFTQKPKMKTQNVSENNQTLKLVGNNIAIFQGIEYILF
jgi:hypothetical protein